MAFTRFGALVALSILTLSLHRCGVPDHLAEKELVRFVQSEKNGLTEEKEVDGIVIKVSYRPTDLMVAQELRNQAKPTEEAIVKARNKYQGHYYFTVSLSKDSKELISPSNQGLSSFSDLLQTISFRMSEIVNLTTGKDTIHVADYIYNRTFSLGSSTDMLFVFEKSKAIGKEYVQFNLNEFGLGIGKQSFQFKTVDLNSAPKIFQPYQP